MSKIIISGSSSGIGKAISQQLLTHDHHVVGLARHHEKHQPKLSRYIPYSIDFSHINRLEPEIKTVLQQHSDLDHLILSAGFGHFATLEQFSTTMMQQLLNVNFLSQAILIKMALPLLKKKQQGNIIIIGSEAALAGQQQSSMYCASKFALRGFSQSLRKECVSANVKVTLINPGLVDTPFFDQLSFEPDTAPCNSIAAEEIASTVLHVLNSPDHCVYEEINLQPMAKVVRKKRSLK